MNGEGIRIWKKAVVTYFKAIFQNMFGEVEEIHDKSRSG
jgi:hypothetical protein